MSEEPLEAIEAMMAERKTSWLGRITDPDGTVHVFDDPKEFAEASGVFRYEEIGGYGCLSQGESEAGNTACTLTDTHHFDRDQYLAFLRDMAERLANPAADDRLTRLTRSYFKNRYSDDA